MLRTTKPNCASKSSGSLLFSSKPGMPETNSRSPVRAANDSGGVVIPAGAAKCLMAAMGHLSCEAGKGSAKAGREGRHYIWRALRRFAVLPRGKDQPLTSPWENDRLRRRG